MTDKITEILGNINVEEFDSFNDNTTSELEFNRSTLNISRDFSWIPIVEETIPYLDYIIRNPKKFLQQEEDIVIVEKSKKVSTETVKHLAQHTNFIQDVDEKGSIKPSKVLNVEKEETWDLYENRFIYTLVKELVAFVDKYAGKDLEDPKEEVKNIVNYSATSSYDNEDIKISLNLESVKNQEPKDFDKEAVKEKIEYIRDVVYGFEASDFIKSLSQAVPVKSPIKKTNIILKDTNFQKALELWEFIKNSEIGEPQDTKESVEDLATKDTKNKFDFGYFLDYLNMSKVSDNDYSEDSLEDKLLSLIEEYVDLTGYSEKKISDFLTSEIKSAIKKRMARYRDISNIYNKYIKTNNNYIKNICDIM